MRARPGLVILLAVLLAACSASPSSPRANAFQPSLGETSTFSVPGVSVPGTPTRYDKVMVRRFGSPNATNVLVLVPGTLAGAADFDIVGPYLADHVPNLQVWAEMRREGALEDNTMLAERPQRQGDAPTGVQLLPGLDHELHRSRRTTSR